MESSPITLWQIDGETMKIVKDFVFGSSKITQMVTAVMKLLFICLFVFAAMKLKDAFSSEEKL